MPLEATRSTEVAIKRLRPERSLPAQAYPGDAGFDLASCERVELAPGARAVVGTGIAVAIPPGHAGLVDPALGARGAARPRQGERPRPDRRGLPR